MTVRTAAGERTHAVTGSPIGPLTLIAEGGRLAGVHMEVMRYEHDAAALGSAVASDSEPVLAAAADAAEELEATARLYLLVAGRRLRTLTEIQVDEIRTRYPIK